MDRHFRNAVGLGCFDLHVQLDKLIGAPLLQQPDKLRGRGLDNFFEIEAAGSLTEVPLAVDFLCSRWEVGFQELAVSFAIISVKGGKPRGRLAGSRRISKLQLRKAGRSQEQQEKEGFSATHGGSDG